MARHPGHLATVTVTTEHTRGGRPLHVNMPACWLAWLLACLFASMLLVLSIYDFHYCHTASLAYMYVCMLKE